MALSGVSLSPEALETFHAFKKSKSDIAFATYKIKGKNVDLDEVVKHDQLKEILSSEEAKNFKQLPNEEDSWACMRYYLTKDISAKYATVMCVYKNKIGAAQEKVTLITWCRDDAPVRERMMISSSKDALKKAFDGVHCHLQANDESDLDYFEAAKNASKGEAVF